ncbi:DUF2177 family protein [bacterium]|nr:DUF2177 family protein [bacterium]
MNYLKTYFISLLVFLGIDSIWLTQISPSIYKHYIGYLLSSNPNLIAALAFYLLYIAGLVYLVVLPALKNKSAKQALIGGAVLGLISYATYDLTNLAVVDKWPLAISIIDMAWGTTLTGVSALLTYKIIRKISK